MQILRSSVFYFNSPDCSVKGHVLALPDLMGDNGCVGLMDSEGVLSINLKYRGSSKINVSNLKNKLDKSYPSFVYSRPLGLFRVDNSKIPLHKKLKH